MRAYSPKGPLSHGRAVRVSSRNAKAGCTSGRQRGIDGGAGSAWSRPTIAAVARAWSSLGERALPLVPSSHGVTLSRSVAERDGAAAEQGAGGWASTNSRPRAASAAAAPYAPSRDLSVCRSAEPVEGHEAGSAVARPGLPVPRAEPDGQVGHALHVGEPVGPQGALHVVVGDVQGSLAHGTAFPRVEVEGGVATVVYLVYQVPRGWRRRYRAGCWRARDASRDRPVAGAPPERAMPDRPGRSAAGRVGGRLEVGDDDPLHREHRLRGGLARAGSGSESSS